MFCEKCGSKIEDDSKFCESCGAPVSAAQAPVGAAQNPYGMAQDPYGAMPAPQNGGFDFSAATASVGGFVKGIVSDKKKRTIAIIIISVLAAAITALCIILSIVNTVHPEDYLSVEYTGIEGYGRIHLDYDENALFADLYGYESFDSDDFWNNKLIAKQYLTFDKYVDIDLNVKNNGHLSNGDVITLPIKYNEEALNAKKKIKDTSITITVDGLGKGTVCDILNDLGVIPNINGISGYGYTNDYTYDQETAAESDVSTSWIRAYDISFSKTEDLKNGDNITITAKLTDNADSIEFYTEQAASAGYILKPECSKEYTVSGLASYPTAAQITPEFKSQLESKALEKLKSRYSELNGKIDSNSVLGTVFLELNDKSRYDYYDVTKAEVAVSVPGDGSMFSNAKTYYVTFENVRFDDSGNLVVDWDDCSSNYYYHYSDPFTSLQAFIDYKYNYETRYSVTALA